MNKFLLGVLAAFALVAATPAYACPDCSDCPGQKKEVAQGTEKKGDKDEKVACPCTGAKECKCGPDCKCACSHCHKDAKKDEKKAT